MPNSNQRKHRLKAKQSYLNKHGFTFIKTDTGTIKVLKGNQFSASKTVFGEYASLDKAVEIISLIVGEGVDK